MTCRKGDSIVREGDWVELYSEEGQLLASFKIKSDMCKEMFDRYALFMYDVSQPFTMKRVKYVSK